MESSLSAQCLDYQRVGIYVWLHCSWSGCSIRTSAMVKHYVPELVVSSYENTGENPWWEGTALSPPLGEALAGGRTTSEADHRGQERLRFKNVDTIGHTAGNVFRRFAGSYGLTYPGAASSF